MREERLKKLEWVIIEIIWNFFLEELREIESDFWIINISWVKISSDLSYLDIYVSSLKNKEMLTKTLAKHAYQIQKRLNNKISLRKLPRVRFRYDDIGEKSYNLNMKIKNLDIKE